MKTSFWLEAAFTTFLVAAVATSACAQMPLEDPGEDKLPRIMRTKPLTIEPKEDELHKLLKARYNVALQEFHAIGMQFRFGRDIALEFILDSQKRVLHAGMELAKDGAEKINLLDDHLESWKYFESIIEGRLKAGRVTDQTLHFVRYHRLDLEIQLLRARRSEEKSK